MTRATASRAAAVSAFLRRAGFAPQGSRAIGAEGIKVSGGGTWQGAALAHINVDFDSPSVARRLADQVHDSLMESARYAVSWNEYDSSRTMLVVHPKADA